MTPAREKSLGFFPLMAKFSWGVAGWMVSELKNGHWDNKTRINWEEDDQVIRMNHVVHI